MAKKKLTEKQTCYFEWYDKASKSMKECGMPAVILYRGKPLCQECSDHIDKSNTAIEVIK